MNRLRHFRVLVFFSAFSVLLFELIISKVANFHLDFRNSYLAIPVTFLGLALGSLHVHFQPRIIERFDIRRSLWMLAAVSFGTFFVIFLAFSEFFGVPAVDDYNRYFAMLLAKTVIFVIVFLPPFYVFGRILTISYHLNRENIGKIYSADFFGAALGCFVTPVLFHFVSLPAVVIILLATISLLIISFMQASVKRRALVAAVLVTLNVGFFFFVSFMDSQLTFLYYAKDPNPPKTREIDSRWNEFSRVQLVCFESPNGKRDYKIIHDNARSNVHVQRYAEGKQTSPNILDALEMPFILERNPKRVMVMFAGCGDEMIRINQYAAGTADITGVELNPAVIDLAVKTPEIRDYRIADFFAKPNVHMRVMEGRSFLEQNNEKFDMIFVGSSAPTGLAFTSNTRKYLYTKEALSRYLHSLNPRGLLLFDHQPTATTVETFKQIFADEGRNDLDKCVMLLRSNNGNPTRGNPDLIVTPDGFRPEDLQKVRSMPRAGAIIYYAPGYSLNSAEAVSLVTSPPSKTLNIVDDRPFIIDLDFKNYKLIPTWKEFIIPEYNISWMQISTFLLMFIVSMLFITLSSLSRSRRLPPSVLFYLLVTGFCYLLIEVVFIAKLELYLQNLLVSMASVVSIFLLTSGIGSSTWKRVAGAMGMSAFPFFVAGVLMADSLALNFVVVHLRELGLVVRLLITAAVIFPVGVVLGMFYPYAIESLVKHGREQGVPVTYGISTLSSVIGASYAMTMMIHWGFNMMLFQASALYLLLGICILIYGRVAKVNMLG